jgi:hypothetical protein
LGRFSNEKPRAEVIEHATQSGRVTPIASNGRSKKA